jgi:Gram-negative bacterial TonB protein C-terminal
MGALSAKENYSQEPVALETAVVATGARPGDSGARRELFTEETQTVLVLEHGAVIRLAAAVADGQLLFLTNKKTGKEVVTQVIRKRSFRPTSCYVDLEFTEASPGFWGIKFPQASAGDARSTDSSDEDSDQSPAKPAPPPDLQEVVRLKQEVSELQLQLKSLTEKPQGPAAAPPPGAAVKEVANAPAKKEKEEDQLLQELLAQESQQEVPGAPKRLVAYPQKPQKASRNAEDRKKRMALAAGLLLVASALAAYRFGLVAAVVGKPPPATSAVLPSATFPSKIGRQKTTGVAGPSTGAANPSDAGVHGPVTAKSADFDAKPPVANPEAARAASTVLNSPAPAAEGKRSDLRGRPRSGKAALASSPSPGSAAGTAEPLAAEEFTAPKLVRVVKPVSPPEALRNYVTGNVNVDALVDTTGHVKSVTVLSGPPKLRNTAIEVMKQYLYEPARKNGKAVPAHVQASLQFWYEP